MLIFYNLFFKPFLKTKKKFFLYFILILILTFSLILLFRLNTYNKLNINSLDANIESRIIETTNLNNELDISYLKNIKHIKECYEIYESKTFIYDNIELENMQSAIYNYKNDLIIGNLLNDNNYEIVLPNYINIGENKIDLSIYYDKYINLSYINSVGEEYNFLVKVIGIYDNYNELSYVFTSNKILSEANLPIIKYRLVIDSVLNVGNVLDILNNVSNSYVISYSDYVKSEKVSLINNILNLVITFIILGLIIIFSIIINNLIYDLRSDIVILRAYGYSLHFILQKIMLIILLVFIISFIISDITLIFIKIFFAKYIKFNLINLNQQLIILLIGFITIMISLTISFLKYKRKSISTFLKSL